MQNGGQEVELAATEEYYDDACQYIGTDFLEVKFYLIGVFAVSIAFLSMIFNSFFVVVFILNASLRRSPLYYFGVLAAFDIILAFKLLWMYHAFLSYLRPMMVVSYTAMFSSLLLILVATVERLLRTFHSARFDKARSLIENHRPLLAIVCVLIAAAYKLCIYFEIHYEFQPNCTDFARYEIVATELASNESYKFYWMFITRNAVDRIAPFFILVIMNVLIIRNLKQADSVDQRSLSVNERANKRVLRDATRALIAMVSFHLCSQSLQVFISECPSSILPSTHFFQPSGSTCTNRRWRSSLYEFYSYINDVISILTLISSAARFPVYCACNSEISSASADTLRQLIHFLCGAKEKEGLEGGRHTILTCFQGISRQSRSHTIECENATQCMTIEYRDASGKKSQMFYDCDTQCSCNRTREATTNYVLECCDSDLCNAPAAGDFERNTTETLHRLLTPDFEHSTNHAANDDLPHSF
ncbi:G-PROTEIN-RECEP-F1-2 domain-containing protein [Aphelenchoides fujianensis]|nr:G-PROTEIN-RECEP-F1-2 domain-containing protein [Aphelenchoides fujianensis]